jgi:hypothetical protein
MFKRIKETKPYWIVAQSLRTGKFFATECSPEGEHLGYYDPEGVLNGTARWKGQIHFTEERAKNLVDRLNKKGPLVLVTKKSTNGQTNEKNTIGGAGRDGQQ